MQPPRPQQRAYSMVGFYMQLSQTDVRRVLHVLAQVKNMGDVQRHNFDKKKLS